MSNFIIDPYKFKEPPQTYEQLDSNVATSIDADKNFVGEGLNAEDAELVGVTLASVTFKLAKNGTPASTVTAQVRESDFTLKHDFGTTYNAVDLPGSVDGSDATDHTFGESEGGDPMTEPLVNGDVIGVYYNDASGSNYVWIRYQNTDVYDGTKAIFNRWNVPGWTDQTGDDCYFSFTST